jgi:RNA polymerase sigma-70 factor (ECF subfamily)
MAPTNLVERLAELLGLPIEVIRAYGKPQEQAVSQAAPKAVGTVSEAEPPYRYATLKAQPSVPPAEQKAPSKKQESKLFEQENELYAQWHDAPAEERPKFEKRLFRVVVRHARNVMWGKIPEADESLARDIAAVVIKQLATFGEESKFSTWVHRIILNHCNLYLRRVMRERERFYQADENLEDPRAEAAFDRVEEGVDLEPLERLLKELPSEDYVLLDCRLDGMTMAKAAEKLGISENAAESRYRRLEARLQKEMRGSPGGK